MESSNVLGTTSAFADVERAHGKRSAEAHRKTRRKVESCTLFSWGKCVYRPPFERADSDDESEIFRRD